MISFDMKQSTSMEPVNYATIYDLTRVAAPATTTATTTSTTTSSSTIITTSSSKQSKGIKDNSMNGGKNYYYDDQLKSFVYNIRQRRQALRLTQERAAQSFRAYTNNNLPYSDHIISYIETFAIAPDKVRELMNQLSSWIAYIENEVSNGQTLKFCASRKSMSNLNSLSSSSLPPITSSELVVNNNDRKYDFLSPTIQAQNLSIFSKLMLQASMLNNVQTNLMNRNNNNNISGPSSPNLSPYSSSYLKSQQQDMSIASINLAQKANSNDLSTIKNNNNNNNIINLTVQQMLTSNVINNNNKKKNITTLSSRLSPDKSDNSNNDLQTNEDGALNLSVNHGSSCSATTSSVSSSISNASRARSSSSSSLDIGDTEDLDKIRAFIEDFKSRRGALGLTQKQAAQCFRSYTNDRFAFSDNFVGHFEGFQFRPQTAITIADSLSEWLEFAEKETREGKQLTFMQGRVKETRKRKYEVIRIRDSAKKILVEAFEENRSPSTNDLEALSIQTGIPTRNIEIWFKNRRTSTQYRTY